jgi:hypothetical protein
VGPSEQGQIRLSARSPCALRPVARNISVMLRLQAKRAARALSRYGTAAVVAAAVFVAPASAEAPTVIATLGGKVGQLQLGVSTQAGIVKEFGATQSVSAESATPPQTALGYECHGMGDEYCAIDFGVLASSRRVINFYTTDPRFIVDGVRVGEPATRASAHLGVREADFCGKGPGFVFLIVRRGEVGLRMTVTGAKRDGVAWHGGRINGIDMADRRYPLGC